MPSLWHETPSIFLSPPIPFGSMPGFSGTPGFRSPGTSLKTEPAMRGETNASNSCASKPSGRYLSGRASPASCGSHSPVMELRPRDGVSRKRSKTKLYVWLSCRLCSRTEIFSPPRPHQTLVSGFLRGLGTVSAIPLVEEARRRHGPDIGVKLLCLCSFDRPIWSKVEEAGGTVPGKYWAEVQPRWKNPTDQDLNYAVAQLIAAGRPGAAMDYAQLDWERIESRHICRILEDLPKGDEADYHHLRVDKHTIKRALEVIGQRQAFSRARLANLELLYLDLFWVDGDSPPNLEREIESNPELFCEAIATAYRPRNKDQNEPDEGEKNRVQMAYRLLMTLSQIPGHDEDGNLASDKILAWIDRVRSRCDDSGHIDACDHHIGQLLSNAPVGDDGVWPCIPVREVLETILNDEVKIGFRNGRYSAPRRATPLGRRRAGAGAGPAIRGLGQGVRLFVSQSGRRATLFEIEL